MLESPQRLCPRCGETVYWHRVYRTRAGVRAFCRDLRASKRADLTDEAVDVWWRLHRITSGEQLDLFS